MLEHHALWRYDLDENTFIRVVRSIGAVQHERPFTTAPQVECMKCARETIGPPPSCEVLRLGKGFEYSLPRRINQSGMDEYFEFLVSNEDVSRSKPDPEIYIAAMARMGVTPSETLIVEDSPHGIEAARRSGIPEDWIDAARRSPIWDLIMTYEVALPLHPEYRTMPMVWYIPPLSPVVDILRDTGHDGEDLDNLFGAVDALRIPVDYLAGLFTAGDPEPVTAVLQRLAAMRVYQRRINLGEERDESIAGTVGMTGQQMDDMYRLLAIAKYEERYVIPAAHAEDAHHLEQLATECSLDYEGGPGMGGGGPYGQGPFGESSGTPAPIQVGNP